MNNLGEEKLYVEGSEEPKVLQSGTSSLSAGSKTTTTNIFMACVKGDTDSVQRLINVGIHVNTKDKQGRTALHFAVSGQHVEIVKMLLKNGACATHATNKGNTLLHTANGNVEIMKIVLQHASDEEFDDFVDAKTADSGSTCLHIAAKNGFYEIVLVLLRNGATYCIKNKQGQKPVNVSTAQNVTKILKLIEDSFFQVTNGNDKVFEEIDENLNLSDEELAAVLVTLNDDKKSLAHVALNSREHMTRRQISKMYTSFKKWLTNCKLG